MIRLFLALLMVQFTNGQGGHSAALSWTDTLNPSGSTTYSVYRATGLCTGTPTFSKLASGVTTLTFVDSTITMGQWCYQVTATALGIEGPPSPQVGATVGPAAPTTLNIVIK